MDILVMAAQLILSLMIMVGLHELGHMLPAKFFGMRVEKFFIGFPPKIFGKKFGETEYGLGAIPLGGFVKISGMMDESMDKSQLSSTPQPWEFRSKPAWQRLIVMIGGVTVNAILGILIFITITYMVGEVVLKRSEIKYGIVAHKLAQEIGLRTGDKIIKVNGKDFETSSDLMNQDVFLSSNSSYTVDRGGQILTIPVPNNILEKLADTKKYPQFIDVVFPFSIRDFAENSPGLMAGLKKDDKIIQADSKQINFYHDIIEYLENKKSAKINLKVLRGIDTLNIAVTTNTDGKIGFYPKNLLVHDTIKYGLSESVVIGTNKAFSVVIDNIRGIGKIFKKEVSAQNAISGPIGIARIFGGEWIWLKFWLLTGMISMILALMNLLPIPALDGGHVVFLLYEMIAGRKPSDRFLEISQYIGMALLLSLMVFAFYNDLARIFMPS